MSMEKRMRARTVGEEDLRSRDGDYRRKRIMADLGELNLKGLARVLATKAPRARIGVRATIAEVVYRDKDRSGGVSSLGGDGHVEGQTLPVLS